jgi:hypothetical protein
MLFALLLFCSASALLVNGILTPGIAQSKDQREVEDKIPKHVPIKVKIKAEKEKAFKDLKNEKWLRDLELEVTNTSGKPIYFLELWVVFPEVIAEDGHKVGIPLRYGRIEFIDFDTVPLPSDMPIPAGATHIFTIPENNQRGWEWHKNKENRPDPKRVEIIFVQLSYGDGSGFNGTDAKPYPYKREQSSSGPCREGPAQGDVHSYKATTMNVEDRPPDLLRKYSFSTRPAEFLPVNFSLPKAGLTTAAVGSLAERNLPDVRTPKANVQSTKRLRLSLLFSLLISAP